MATSSIIIVLAMALLFNQSSFGQLVFKRGSFYMGSHRIISREQWRAQPPKNAEPLAHPTGLVIVSHTASNPCRSIKECSRLMRAFQEHHFTSFGWADIGYNFLIGGDGNIYEGRDWDSKSFHKVPNSIGVSFIGNFIFDEVSDEMKGALEALLEEGVKLGKLEKEYKIVAHNQTESTLSPGPNLYRFVKGLPHFDADRQPQL